MKRRARQFLWTCWYRGWAVLAAAIILLALLFSVARLLLPLAPGYKHEIQTRVGELIQRPVTIDRMGTDWKWFRPRLKLTGVSVEGLPDGQSIRMDQVVLGINLFESLLNWSVEVDDIRVGGTHLSVRRDADGRFFVQQIALGGWTGDVPLVSKIPSELFGRTIRLVDGTVDYTDEQLNLDYRLHGIDAALRLESEALSLYLDAGLPETLGDRFEFAVELGGALERPETLNGRVFVRGRDLDLANWAGRLGAGDRVQQGRGSLSAWFGVGGQRHYEATARLDAQNLAVELHGDRLWQAATARSDARLRIDQQQIALDLARLQIERNGRTWQEAGLSFRTPRDPSARYRRGALAGSFVRLEDLFAWTGANAGLREVFGRAHIDGLSGDVNGFSGRWDFTGAEPALGFEAGFAGLGVTGHGPTPTLRGLDGSVRVNETAVDLHLHTDALVFDYPALFRGPLPEAVVDGRIRLRRLEDGWRIATRDLWLDTAHAQTRHWIDLDLPRDGPPRIDARGLASASDAAAAPRYIPTGITGPGLLKWLDNAIGPGVALNGEYELAGPLNRFPFRDGGGVFRVEFDTEGNSLNFWPPGPVAEDIRAHVKFEGPGLWIDAYQARILDSTAHDVQVAIRDFREAPTIELHGNLYGPLRDVVEYVRSSGLRRSFEGVIDGVSAGGRYATAVDLTVPLGRDAGPVLYDFAGALHNARLSLDEAGLAVTGVQSRLNVSDKGVDSPVFDARLNGQAVQMELATEGRGGGRVIEARLNGELQAGELLQNWQAPLADRVTGASDWRARLRFSGGGAGEGRLGVTLNSDLAGTRIDLPAPLGKPAEGGAPLEFNAEAGQGRIDTRVQWDGWLRGVMRFADRDGDYQITRADIRATAGTPAMPDQPGIRLAGRVPELNIDHWRKVYRRQQQGGGGVLGRLDSVDLQTGRLTVLGRTANNISVALSRQSHNWAVRLDSGDISGRILIPRQGFSQRGLAIDLEYADFDRLNRGASGERPAPTDVPPFQLSARSLKLNDWDLREVRMLAEPADQSLVIHRLGVLDPTVGLEGEGRWLLDDNGEHRTRLKLNFDSNNVGTGMARFGFAQMIKGADGHARFDVHWPDAPSAFSLDILQGDAEIALDEGQILELEPGGGRIFGLLSLQTIPRRLALDFSDLFGKGYRFDKMRGSFTVVDGNAFTSDYYIDGPMGRIDVRGRIGLAQRDYDQEVVFRPDLSSSLPLVGALVGGATGGWAVILADRVARMFGKQADDLGRVEYRLTGSWDQPKMNPVVDEADNN